MITKDESSKSLADHVRTTAVHAGPDDQGAAASATVIKKGDFSKSSAEDVRATAAYAVSAFQDEYGARVFVQRRASHNKAFYAALQAAGGAESVTLAALKDRGWA